jgi:transcriptional regulator with XRE-family HTH domain
MYPVVAYGHSPWSNELVRDLTEEEFRHEYMMDQVRSYIAFQIRALREQPGRRWSQADLAKKSGKTQSVISRLEDPDYGKLSLQSLLEIAIAFELPLLVQFVEWDDWLARMSNLSPSALRKRSFDAGRLMNTGRGETANLAGAPSGIQAASPAYLGGSYNLNTSIMATSANTAITGANCVEYRSVGISGQSILTQAGEQASTR